MRLLHSESEAATLAGCVLVPTMGALHQGHAALIRHAARIADARSCACAATIFVNPTQFNDPGDLARYPRTLDADLALCAAAGAAAVFAPDAGTVYPGWPEHRVAVPPLPPVATQPGLEDSHRPGHFAGVCQVVQRLFDLTHPAAAVFGEKDWQQLRVIRAMVAAGGAKMDVIPSPTVRDPDGLALSSRNRFLSPADRSRALALSTAIAAAAAVPDLPAARRALADALQTCGVAPEYAVIRDADTLGETTQATRTYRTLIAARIGSVRLIDNGPWSGGPQPASGA